MKLLDIVRSEYGMTIKEAKAYISSMNDSMKKALIECFENNSKRSFYED